MTIRLTEGEKELRDIHMKCKERKKEKELESEREQHRAKRMKMCTKKKAS